LAGSGVCAEPNDSSSGQTGGFFATEAASGSARLGKTTETGASSRRSEAIVWDSKGKIAVGMKTFYPKATFEEAW
jgi:hypothetical protein